ncbi:MAG TPA: SDR family oxidoreductase [Planctomycetaceae bacterium]|jgi:NAD(P)-dependent dehydrogenase (short-subunit alcohol dehydrogenase family)|nr:SDR family oxidoreductase [Planctomycetaceae bacterium]
MELKGSVAVVTGGASGIGRALCQRFAAEGARGIVVSDMNELGAQAVATEVKGLAVSCDVGVEAQIIELVRRAEEAFGSIDLFCSNAGLATRGGEEAPDADWLRNWDVHLMSHVYAARAVLPGMLKRGRGYLLNTASAAGLLTEMGSAPYSVTKHAAVAFAEWLSIQHYDAGIRVSCLCPMGVTTNMLAVDNPHVNYLKLTAVTAEHAAEECVKAIREERFLVLPHPEVKEFYAYRANDTDRWMNGMRRLNKKIRNQF